MRVLQRARLSSLLRVVQQTIFFLSLEFEVFVSRQISCSPPILPVNANRPCDFISPLSKTTAPKSRRVDSASSQRNSQTTWILHFSHRSHPKSCVFFITRDWCVLEIYNHCHLRWDILHKTNTYTKTTLFIDSLEKAQKYCRRSPSSTSVYKDKTGPTSNPRKLNSRILPFIVGQPAVALAVQGCAAPGDGAPQFRFSGLM